MKNVLVFPCGSEIGLELYRSIGKSTHFKLYGGSSVDDHGRFVYENYIDDIPKIDDYSFETEINKIINDYNIDFIFPAHDSVVLKLAKARDANNLNCEVVTSPYATCLISRSKSKTYKLLDGVISVPKIYEKNQLSGAELPLFLKPDIGQGSKGTYKATTLNDIDYHTKNDPTLIILEYLPGKEYTVDCFTDFEGNLIFAEGRLRKRVSNGISVSSESVYDERFKEIAYKINNKLTFNGVWFFQLKESNSGELVLLEVAPRVAGTMGLVRGRGANLALMSLFNIQNIKVDITYNEFYLIIDRALENKYKHNIKYNHVYVDLDDTLILNKKINLELITFLYQCINNSIPVHLITKHKSVIKDTLELYRISNLFEDIISVDDSSSKADAISLNNSIFIDDSHSERKHVKEKKGIPVFDTHALEVLIER